MGTCYQLEEFKSYFNMLIEKWDVNEKGEKDELSVRNNCLLNTICLYRQLKANKFSNRFKLCYGCYYLDNFPMAHIWIEMLINNNWEILDITQYYNTKCIKSPYRYNKTQGGYFTDGVFKDLKQIEDLLLKQLELFPLKLKKNEF